MRPASKIFHIYQDRQNLCETLLELQNEPLFCILCDVLYLPDPDQNARISKEFERTIRKYLWFQKQFLTEKTLSKALEQAQKYFIKNYEGQSKNLKISALILIEEPKKKATDSRSCLVCGVGDFKLFKVDKPSSLLFYDIETPQLPLNLSLKKRFNYLSNVIGSTNLQSSVQRLNLSQTKALLVISYGTYNLIPEEKWLQYATDFENKKNLIFRSLFRSKDKDHLKHYMYISLDCPYQSKQHSTQNTPSLTLTSPKSRLSPVLTGLIWSSKIIAVLILGLCILELTQHKSSLKQFAFYERLKNPLKEPEMSLNFRSMKRPMRFPLVRERAYLIDLKEKNDRQTLVIEKLHNKVREQDKALRDLQVKHFTSQLTPIPFPDKE